MVPIIQKRNIPFTVSLLLVVASIVSIVVFGLTPGIDFTGGSLVELSFPGVRPTGEQIQTNLAPLGLGPVVVQTAGEDNIILKMRFLSEAEHQSVLATIRTEHETDENRVIENRFETVGPAVSSQLRSRAFSTGILVLVAILVFIAFAFRGVSRPVQSWYYGVAALVALLHDVIITIGAFAAFGYFFHVEADIPFVVAVLTVLGYSVNDTIVVFDRIRENLIKHPKSTFVETVNTAVNETFVRSVNTSLTVLLVLTALFLFGGESIRYFALTLIVGIFIGTYSSIFIASPVLVTWYEWRQKRRV